MAYATPDRRLRRIRISIWLYRALNGHAILFPSDIGERYTTMTYGADVARGITLLLGNGRALGEVVQIASPEAIKWNDVLEIYLNVIESCTGKRPKLKYTNFSDTIGKVTGRKYQIVYDRLYDRYFESQKINHICGKKLTYVPVREGLKMCVEKFLMGEQEFKTRDISWKFEGFADRQTGERYSLDMIPTIKRKVKYGYGYCMPFEGRNGRD